MDIVSHALTGASTGLLFSHPLLGAALAVLPDVVLGPVRKSMPSAAYNLGHSALGISVAALAGAVWSQGLFVLLCLLSHVVLDLPTHGKVWGPPLLFPFSGRRFSFGSEWEFFNTSWQKGLILTFLWNTTCLLLFVTGFHF